ncbi:MAG: hypothetical protein KC476_06910, partial [Cyanobacteria bacterium HKST-UBA06]|nr:hypothetical protein [Cyanobacteria bacterium HKST-UBA06]
RPGKNALFSMVLGGSLTKFALTTVHPHMDVLGHHVHPRHHFHCVTDHFLSPILNDRLVAGIVQVLCVTQRDVFFQSFWLTLIQF